MKSLEEVLSEAETSDDVECTPCRIAAGIGITRNICQEFKEQIDCSELVAMLDNPDLYTLEQVQKTIERIAEGAQGKPRELLLYTTCLMKGECRPSEPPRLR